MRTCIFYSVMKSDIDSVKVLIKYKASLDHVDTFGKNLLDYAMENFNINIIKILVKHGANLGKECAKGK